MQDINPVDALFERAREYRVPMSQVCHRAGVAPTTPSRWKHNRNGATVEAVMKLSDALGEIIAERAA